MNRTSAIGLALLCATLTAAAQIALKTGLASRSMQTLLISADAATFLTKAVSTPLVLFGLALYAISAILWLLVLAKLDLSYAYPFVSLGFVLTALYGYFALHDPMSYAKAAGTALIVVGVYLVAKA